MKIISKFFNFLIITLLMTINLSIFATITLPTNQTNQGIGDKNQSTPIITDYNKPPRDLSVFVDNGNTEKAQNVFFTTKNENNGVTLNLMQNLQIDSPLPLLVSSGIFMNLIARQTLVNDLLNLDQNAFFEKIDAVDMNGIEVSRSTIKFDTWTKVLQYKTLLKNIIEAQETLQQFFDAHLKNPNQDTLNSANKALIDYNGVINSSIKSDKARTEDILFNLIPFKEALDLNKWAIGKTATGDYVLLPKDQNGALLPTDLNYKELDGFNGNTIISGDLSTMLKLGIQSDTNKIADAQLDLLKTNDPECRPSNVLLNGHGSDGLIANIDITYFNKTVIPGLEKSHINTFMYDTCFGSDINAQKAFQDENKSLGTHSFTIISGGNSFAPTYRYTNNNALYAIESILSKQNELLKKSLPLMETIELQKEFHSKSNTFNALKLRETDLSNATQTLFSNREKNNIKDIQSTSSIKLATTDYWIQTAADFKNVIQISNTADAVKSSDRKTFKYDLQKEGGILLSNETTLAPIIIEDGAALPYIIPISVGEKIHYIKSIEIKDTSMTIKNFIEKSIKPFIDQMNIVKEYGKNKAKKTIVIDELKTLEGIAKIVITEDYALYTINSSSTIIDNQTDLKIITFSSNNKDIWGKIDDFQNILKQAHDQETKQELYIENIEKISTAVHDRQAALRLIQKLTEKVDWNDYSRTNDLSNKNAVFNALIDAIKANNNQPLDKYFFDNLSPNELTIINTVLSSLDEHLIKSNELKNAFLKTFSLEENYFSLKTLQQTFQELSNIDIHAILDWYATLSLNDQNAIKFKFNAFLEKNIDDLLDPNTLSLTEQFLVKNFLKQSINLSSNQSQINDLQEKLQKVSTTKDENSFNEYMMNRIGEISSNKIILLDYLSILTESEKNPFAQDLLAFIGQEISNDPTLSEYNVYNLNITEIFTLKLYLEQIQNIPESEKENFFEKISTHGLEITVDNFFKNISTSLNTLDNSIKSKFLTLSESEQALLFSADSVDIYAKIFKTLPFATQTDIANNLSLLKEDQTDLIKYQQSLIDERIKTAQTVEDFSHLQADITAAKIPLTGPQKTLLKNDFLSAESAENKAEAEGVPLVSKGSTGTVVLDPEIINQETGQPIIIDNTNKNQTDPSKPIDTPGKIIPDTNPFEDEKTKEEYDKEAADEKAREDAARAATSANEEAQQEALKQEQSGNHEPVVFDIR